MGFQSPALEYGALAPMLIIFGAAIIGVIVEAFLSAKVRAPIQLAISLGAVVLSLSQVWRLRGSATTTAAVNSVVIDGPVLFMQGTILILSLFALLLIADIDGNNFREVVRDMEIVRLGQGVDETGQFHPDAIARTLAAVDKFAAEIAKRGVEKIRFCATSATRDATNRHVFVDGVRERLGIELEVISGEEAVSYTHLTLPTKA